MILTTKFRGCGGFEYTVDGITVNLVADMINDRWIEDLENMIEFHFPALWMIYQMMLHG